MDLMWIRCAVLVSTTWAIYTFRSVLFNGSIRRSLRPNLWSIDAPMDKKAHQKAENGRKKQNPSDLTRLKELFFQLHHLEDTYDQVLPEVDSTLRKWISEALDNTLLRPKFNHGILSLDIYSRTNLQTFLKEQHDSSMHKYEQYTLRRKSGQPRELFPTREDAARYIRRLAPLRLVDGAWLAHISQTSSTTTPPALRRVLHSLWQILSEELGDGSLAKNHVHVYTQLLNSIGPSPFPAPHTPEFLDEDLGMDDIHVWKAAVAQHLISLLPHRYLPEILGFNLHFEGIALETLINCRELRELGLDARYYLLHVSIDNNHSGHSAIAFEAVDEYMAYITQLCGGDEDAVQRAWNGVKAGYILSEQLTSKTNLIQPPEPSLSKVENRVLEIMKAKAPVAVKMHAASPLRIGNEPIDAWLADLPHSAPRRRDFLQTLKNTPSMVQRGKSADSRLVKEMMWGGKMFGAFTTGETVCVKEWIDGLKPPKAPGKQYADFVGLEEESMAYDVRLDKLAWTEKFSRRTPLIEEALKTIEPEEPFSVTLDGLKNVQEKVSRRLMPLHFASLKLFEGFASTPSLTATEEASRFISVLCAQHGLSMSMDGVGGIDEAMRTDRMDLYDFGVALAERLKLESNGEEIPEWSKEVEALALKPWGNRGLLVGLGCAFVQLREALKAVFDDVVFAEMVDREKGAIESVIDDERKAGEWKMVRKGYAAGLMMVEDCLR